MQQQYDYIVLPVVAIRLVVGVGLVVVIIIIILIIVVVLVVEMMSLMISLVLLGEVGMLLCVAGGNIWRSWSVTGVMLECDFSGQSLGHRRSTKCCISKQKMLWSCGKGNLSELTGCGCQFHGRISLGACSDHSRTSDHGRIMLARFSIGWRKKSRI